MQPIRRELFGAARPSTQAGPIPRAATLVTEATTLHSVDDGALTDPPVEEHSARRPSGLCVHSNHQVTACGLYDAGDQIYEHGQVRSMRLQCLPTAPPVVPALVLLSPDLSSSDNVLWTSPRSAVAKVSLILIAV